MPDLELLPGETKIIEDVATAAKIARESLSDNGKLALAISLSRVVRPELEFLQQMAKRHGKSG